MVDAAIEAGLCHVEPVFELRIGISLEAGVDIGMELIEESVEPWLLGEQVDELPEIAVAVDERAEGAVLIGLERLVVVAQVYPPHIRQVVGRSHAHRGRRGAPHDIDLSHSPRSDVVEHVDILHASEVETLCVLREEKSQCGSHGGMFGHPVGSQSLQVVALVPGDDLEQFGIRALVAEENLEHIECVGRHLVVDGRALDPHLGTVGEGRLCQFEAGERCRNGCDGQGSLGTVGVFDGLDILGTQLCCLLPSLDGLAPFMESENVCHDQILYFFLMTLLMACSCTVMK